IDYSRYMDKLQALEALGALAHETRLEVFRLLVQAGPDGVPAGEIADALGVRQHTMSSHLACLTRAALITKLRDGRVILYSARYEGMRQLLLYLLEDCCGGDTEICAPIVEAMACAC
ncbi:MAG TPA: metalloregulator ArsR/SmtB family transcription factor, partial [Gammaproteobacteria bacterium]|nr:metalloregulator ArsR/SmtB family transcription factor [Gammaproteobacteria bacterium]